MLKDQSNRCAMCDVEFILNGLKTNLNRLPCIDHSHQTNEVRGLLCRMCNIALGYLEAGIIDKAKEYLRVHEMRNNRSS